MAKSPDSPQVECLLTEADWLRRLARYLVHDQADADDLVQETWMTAIRSPAPDARASMRPWLALVGGRQPGRGRANRPIALEDGISSVCLREPRGYAPCMPVLTASGHGDA